MGGFFLGSLSVEQWQRTSSDFTILLLTVFQISWTSVLSLDLRKPAAIEQLIVRDGDEL